MYEDEMKSSYDGIISAVDDFFWPLGSKHCNIDGRSVWTAREETIVEKLTTFGLIPAYEFFLLFHM